MTRFGYAHVSTPNQNLSEQIDELSAKGVERKNIFAEKMTGTREDRP